MPNAAPGILSCIHYYHDHYCVIYDGWFCGGILTDCVCAGGGVRVFDGDDSDDDGKYDEFFAQ